MVGLAQVVSIGFERPQCANVGANELPRKSGLFSVVKWCHLTSLKQLPSRSMAGGSVELFPCRNDRRMQLEAALVTRLAAAWFCLRTKALATKLFVSGEYSPALSEWMVLTSLVRQSARL
jgi:hypothetical protein